MMHDFLPCCVTPVAALIQIFLDHLPHCRRCRDLSHGRMIPAVEDQWAVRQRFTGNNRPLVSPKQLREQLLVIRETAAVVVLLVDLLDASGSFLSKLRDLTGRNPIVLVGTKARAPRVSMI